jgi:hypothetical protein
LVGFEEGANFIEVGVGDGIVFVVVAFGAVDGEAEERFAEMFDGFFEPLVAIEEEEIAGEVACGAEFGGICGVEFIGGEHFANELIVGGIGVERFDDPVAPMPEIFLAIAELVIEAPPVAVAPDIHVVARPAFAVARIMEEAFGGLGVGIGVGIGEEGVDFFAGGREADEIEEEASEEDEGRGIWLGGKGMGLVILGDEGVDGIADPEGIGGGGDGRSGRWEKGPMGAGVRFGEFIFWGWGTGGDPVLEELDLGWGEGFAFVAGGHAVIGIFFGDAFDEEAFGGLAGEERGAGFSAFFDEVDGIEAEIGFLFEGTVAGEAAGAEEGFDVALVIGGGGGGWGQEKEEEEEGGGG